MGRELEYKFSATEAIQQRIREVYGDFHSIAMQTVYYDTPDRSLSARRCTLRLRQENGSRIFTLKTPLPDGSRAEWEVPAPSVEAGLQALPQARELVTGPLEPVCGARFTRLAKLLSLENVTLELALDRGILTGGGRELPLCEVEVEYKSGDQEAAKAFAQALALRFGLAEEPRSKFARAMALAEGEHHD